MHFLYKDNLHFLCNLTEYILLFDVFYAKLMHRIKIFPENKKLSF